MNTARIQTLRARLDKINAYIAAAPLQVSNGIAHPSEQRLDRALRAFPLITRIIDLISKATLAPAEVPAAATVASFKNTIETTGATFNITWFWVGRTRHGLITVRTAAGQFAEFPYARNESSWTLADETLNRLHTGGPKHKALASALAWLRAQPLLAETV